MIKISDQIKFEMGILEMDWKNGVQTSNRVFWKVLDSLLNKAKQTETEEYEKGIVEGMELQSKIMYSEKEVLDLICTLYNKLERDEIVNPIKFFEEHKKVKIIKGKWNRSDEPLDLYINSKRELPKEPKRSKIDKKHNYQFKFKNRDLNDIKVKYKLVKNK